MLLKRESKEVVERRENTMRTAHTTHGPNNIQYSYAFEIGGPIRIILLIRQFNRNPNATSNDDDDDDDRRHSK